MIIDGVNPNQVLLKGKILLTRLCNVGIRFNGKPEHFVKWRGAYYHLISSYDTKTVYSETFYKINATEEMREGCSSWAKCIKDEIEKDVDIVKRDALGYYKLFRFLYSQTNETEDPALLFVNFRAISYSQKSSLILFFPSIVRVLLRKKVVFTINMYLETHENIKILKHIQTAYPQAVFLVSDLVPLLTFLQKKYRVL